VYDAFADVEGAFAAAVKGFVWCKQESHNLHQAWRRKIPPSLVHGYVIPFVDLQLNRAVKQP